MNAIKWFLIGSVLMVLVQGGLLLALAVLAAIWNVSDAQSLRPTGYGTGILVIGLAGGLLSAVAAQWHSCASNCRHF